MRAAHWTVTRAYIVGDAIAVKSEAKEEKGAKIENFICSFLQQCSRPCCVVFKEEPEDPRTARASTRSRYFGERGVVACSHVYALLFCGVVRTCAVCSSDLSSSDRGSTSHFVVAITV